MSDTTEPTAVGSISQVLGEQWSITPLGWSWLRGGSPSEPLHMLVLETTVGRLGFAFNPDDLGTFLRTGENELGGIVVPRPGEVLL